MGAFSYLTIAPAAFLSFFWFLASGILYLREEKPLAISQSTLAGLIGASLIFLACPPTFRVLNDETAFLNMAQALLSTGKPGRGQEFLWESGLLAPLESVPPFRPAMFSVLIAVASAISGRNTWQGFLISFFAAALVLSLVGGKSGTKRAAFWALVAVCANPVFAFTAASSGYDLLSLAFGLSAALLLSRFRSSGRTVPLLALLGATLCFAHTRTEGLLGFSIVVGWILFRGPCLSNTGRIAVGFALALTLPLVAQRIYFFPHVDLKEMADLMSLTFLPPNSLDWIRAFFLEPLGPFPVLLHWLGLGALWKMRERFRREVEAPALAFMAAYFFILLTFHDGFTRHPFQARLYLPFSFLLCWAATAIQIGKKTQVIFLVAITLQMALAVPHFLKGHLYFRHPAIEELEAERPFVEASPSKAVFVAFNSGTIAAHGRAAIRPQTFDLHRTWLGERLKKEKAGPVFFFEIWPSHKMAISKTIGENDAKTIAEIPLEGMRQLRVRELFTSPDGLPAPALK